LHINPSPLLLIIRVLIQLETCALIYFDIQIHRKYIIIYVSVYKRLMTFDICFHVSGVKTKRFLA